MEEQGLARFATPFDSSGKTPAECHHRNHRERNGRPHRGRLDVVAGKPFIDIPKFASARSSERSLVRARAGKGHST
ncbi:hypothetical protein ACVJGC_001793 [Bradyrhizobium diazoefficiens]|uniref:hypothetical protein n=1 Tax=Bradyrhizobium diazoefficiens TaxID=1355477 RepID=UPI00272D5AB7|nr:hypothetical protein [Bradyrhizobium diazoefficiens]WLA58966.1 hypothetical protein QIH81_09955 [Bradyrhizobium diazoefficiens]